MHAILNACSDRNLRVICYVAAKASINPDTVISYWKPEVTVKLVNDFTRYPYDYCELIEPLYFAF